MLTKEIILQIMPHAKDVDVLLPFLLDGMESYQITGTLRENHFLAQIAHESGEFRYLKEIASGSAYEGRADLGNTQQGDGIRFKGRGLIQITGRSNYAHLSRDLGVDFLAQPVLLETPEYACLSACWFWNSKNLNAWADKDDFLTITKRINGGTIGIEDRQMYLERAIKFNV